MLFSTTTTPAAFFFLVFNILSINFQWEKPNYSVYQSQIWFSKTYKARVGGTLQKFFLCCRPVLQILALFQTLSFSTLNWSKQLQQHWGLVWSLLSCKWGVLFGSPLIGSVGEQWFGNRKSSGVIGSRRRSSAVGSLRKWSEVVGEVRKSSGIKERHLSSYYTIVTSELIYVYEGWGWHMWERKGFPARGAGANQNACAVPKIEKRM